MRFVFVGNPQNAKDAREGITAYGIHFPLGESVEVENDDIALKLLGNSHFEAADELRQEAPRRRGRPPKVQNGEP